jgi:exopolyphosphatase / guanosine-5'-triphosphate,3'-diphosphate pyrophosphatase
VTALAEARLKMGTMRAGVIDVGSNTVRLLVAASSRRGLSTVLSERTHLALATDIERDGRISDRKLSDLADVAAEYAASARDAGADPLEVIVTAPGRQSANARVLHGVLAEATGLPVRQLSADEEGRLAYAGAVAGCRSVREPNGVIDVGGGSTQLMVGTVAEPAWLQALDVGSLRLTERYVENDPASKNELAVIAEAVERAFEGVTPPIPRSVLAAGGTARALRPITGKRFGQKQLRRALEALTSAPVQRVARKYEISPERARVLPAGILVLREAHRRLGVTFEVARGGVREGAILGLLAELAEAAAA